MAKVFSCHHLGPNGETRWSVAAKNADAVDLSLPLVLAAGSSPARIMRQSV